jgi:opacity protein-like surface antigen
MGLSSKLCIAVAALLAFFTEAHADSWEHELTTLLWASSLDGRESIGPVSVDVNASFGDLVEFLDVGGALRFTAQRERIGWFIEAGYVELSEDTTVLTVPTGVEFAQTIAEAGLSFDLVDHFAIYGGARYQALDVEITNALLRSIRRDVDWIDAIAGARWTPIETDAWRAWLRADIGAGGSELQWLAETGLAWRFASSWSAQLAYRILDVDYESDRFGYDMRQSGLLLGIGVRF